jgi:hypothetical protein
MVIVWAVILPLTWSLAGCGGDKKAEKKTAKPTPTAGEKETKEPATTGTAKEEKETAPAAKVEGWGTIKGRVVFAGEPPEPAMLHKAGDQDVKDTAVCAAADTYSEELVVNKSNKGIKWVAVYVGGRPPVKPELAEAGGEVEFGQKNCVFKPHVFAYRAGQKVIVSSEDAVTHNTNVNPKRGQPFNPTIPAASEGGKKEMPGPELKAQPAAVAVACNIHRWMKAWWFVFDHPYFAVTDENGAFEIKNVPATKLKLMIWQEKLQSTAKAIDVEVKPDETVELPPIELAG